MMLSHQTERKRPVSSNPKLPSIKSPESSQKNSNIVTEQITIIPVKTPAKTWPPPLNLSPLNLRRNSDTGRTQISGEYKKGYTEKKSQNDLWIKSNSATTSDFEKQKDHQDLEKKRSTQNRFQSEDSTELTTDRLKKDKRIMTNLLKQTQKELMKKESGMKELLQENEQLKKEIAILKVFSAENKETKQEIKKSDDNTLCTVDNLTEQSVEPNENTNMTEEIEKRFSVLQQENKILKECLNTIYSKISFIDSAENDGSLLDMNITEDFVPLLSTEENFELKIEKINQRVEQIRKEYDKFSKKVNECKECISWHLVEDLKDSKESEINEKLKSVEQHNEQLMKEFESKEKEIQTLSVTNQKLKESAKTTELRFEELEKEIIGLQLDNNKLEEFLLVCRKAQKELQSTNKQLEEKHSQVEEEKNEVKSEIEKMKTEFKNFQLNIMETVSLALDIEPLDMKAPADVLTTAIVEMAEECHALRATVGAMETKEKEELQRLQKLYSCIIEVEEKLEKEGRRISSLQEVICKFGLTEMPKNTNLDQAVIKIYSNWLSWEKNIINQLTSFGIEENNEDLHEILKNLSSQKIVPSSVMHDIQPVENENKEMNTDILNDKQNDVIENSNACDSSVQLNCDDKQSNQSAEVNNSICEHDSLDNEVPTKLPLEDKTTDDLSEDAAKKLYQFISPECDFNLSTDLLHQLIGNSNKISSTLNSSNTQENSVEESYIISSLEKELLNDIKESLNINDNSINKQHSKNTKNKNDSLKQNTEGNQPIKTDDNKLEVCEQITKKEFKTEEAVPYDRNYLMTRDIGIQVQDVEMNETGTQIEEADIQHLQTPKIKDSQIQKDAEVQTDNDIENSIPEKMEELELTVAEMKHVEKQHMHVACDMAEKLNLLSQREAELKEKMQEMEENRTREIESLKLEWLELEKRYKHEITAWQHNTQKQSYAIHQLQMHIEQAQHLMYEKDIEITEMQRTIVVLQEKLQQERNEKGFPTYADKEKVDEELYKTEEKNFGNSDITSEDVLQHRIQHINEQLEATKACLMNSRIETAKSLKREMEYYNDIIQKKEHHIKKVQAENAQLRAEVEGKDAIILQQRKEIRQSSLRWHRYEKELWGKDETIRKLKQKFEYNGSQTEQEKLSTIGTRCLEEKHHQIIEELRSKVQEIESGFSSMANTEESTEPHIYNTLSEWKQGNQFQNSNNLDVIQEQPFNELFLYDTIKHCEEVYLNLVNALAHALGITELEGAASLVIVPHTEWRNLIDERTKDQRRFVNAIEILKTLAENELIDQEERFRNMEDQLHSATEEITTLQADNRLKMQELKQAEKILRITRRSLERERLINSSIKQNRKKLEQLTARIISQKEDDMNKAEEVMGNISLNGTEINFSKRK